MNTPGYAETTARRRIVFPWMGKRDRTGLPGTVARSCLRPSFGTSSGGIGRYRWSVVRFC